MRQSEDPSFRDFLTGRSLTKVQDRRPEFSPGTGVSRAVRVTSFHQGSGLCDILIATLIGFSGYQWFVQEIL
jgi:hypothetical protein